MIDGTNIFTYSNCWVYILREEPGQKKTKVAFALTLKELLSHSRNADLLYYRQFTQMTEAMGHKLLLENLSGESLYNYITQMNPEMTDLREEFLK